MGNAKGAEPPREGPDRGAGEGVLVAGLRDVAIGGAAAQHAARVVDGRRAAARKLLGWPKRCRLAHAFLWEHSYKRLKLAQLLGQLGVFLTCAAARR
jgi:hypothetical protein